MINDSLRKEVDKRLREDIPILSGERKTKIWNIVNNYKKWNIIFGITVFVFFFINYYINIQFLDIIDVDSSAVKQLVESRTANATALISITFVIIGLLLANLSIKESFMYHLLFEKSFFSLLLISHCLLSFHLCCCQ